MSGFKCVRNVEDMGNVNIRDDAYNEPRVKFKQNTSMGEHALFNNTCQIVGYN